VERWRKLRRANEESKRQKAVLMEVSDISLLALQHEED